MAAARQLSPVDGAALVPALLAFGERIRSDARARAELSAINRLLTAWGHPDKVIGDAKWRRPQR
jgi:hypothetical protein